MFGGDQSDWFFHQTLAVPLLLWSCLGCVPAPWPLGEADVRRAPVGLLCPILWEALSLNIPSASADSQLLSFSIGRLDLVLCGHLLGSCQAGLCSSDSSPSSWEHLPPSLQRYYGPFLPAALLPSGGDSPHLPVSPRVFAVGRHSAHMDPTPVGNLGEIGRVHV